MKNRKSKTIKKTATALVVTVEKFQKDSLTDYQTQGDCKPYTKCRTSSLPRTPVECLSGYKDIKKSIGDLKRVLKNWNIEDTHTFVFVISKIIGAEPSVERMRIAKNVDEISYYLNLPQYSFRLGLHNLKAKNYQGNRQKKSNYGVTFKEPNLPNTFEAKDGVNVVEFVYVYWTPELLRKVAQAILHLLETGQWDESIAPADAKNISPMKKNEKVEGGNPLGDKLDKVMIYKIPLKVKDVYKSGEKMNISLARNMAIGLDLSENELMQLCELGLVIEAKRIAHLNESLKFRFEKMVDLYGRQLTIQPKDSRSATLQQYSTPCPLAFLLGEYVKKGTEEREDDNLKFFEPTAGNGLLTISFRAYQMVVNELDDIRFNNLKRLFFFRTTNEDATCSSEPLKCFSGIIANPPFAPLEKKDFLVRKGVVDGREATYEFDRLDHKIAIMALDHMKDDGRAAIIIGGKMAVKLKDYKESYWKNGVLFGGFRNFITYLNRQYNIEDILYINGDLYRKQGTTFPIVAILINGRTKWNGDKRHQWHPFDKSKDGQIDTFNELYHRMGIHLEEEPTAKNKLIVDSRNTMRLAFNHLVKELGEEEGKKTFEWYCKTYDVNIGDPMPASVRREIFGVESVPSALKAKALMLKMKMAKSRGLEGIDEDKCIKQIAVLHKAADSINNWIEKNKSGRFFIKLPRKVEKEISKIIGRSVDVHKIDSNGIRHSLKNHGEKGRKLQINDIPIKKEYYMLIPYIMVSPDYIEKGSNDFGRESIRFVKNLSNGTLIVVEKESLNDKDVFETVNMWGTLSDVVNAKSPNIHVRNVAISTSDVANIIKDAELAIIKDEKK